MKLTRIKPEPLLRPDTVQVYGPSGVGKTTLAYYLSLWMYEKYGLTTRIVSADPGSWGPIESEGLIQAGIVDAFNVSGRASLLADMRKLAKGWWPKHGEVEIEEREQPDGSIKQVKVRKKYILEDKEAYAKVGLYMFEGSTSLSTGFLRHICRTGEKIGPQDTAGKYEEDGEVFGGNSQGHYNIVQNEMYSLYTQTGAMPSPVRLVVWTGHPGKGVDKAGDTCYCPAIAGEAKNAEVPSWVGDCFHLEDTPELLDSANNVIQEKSVKAYYVKHPDKVTDVYYLCKTRVGPSGLSDLKEKFPDGYIPLGLERGSNIDAYFEWLDQRRSGNMEKVLKWRESLSGISS